MVPKEVSIEKETFTEPGGQSGIADRLFSHVSTFTYVYSNFLKYIPS